MSLLAETFGRRTTEALIEGYWLALHDLDERDFVAAIETLLSQSRFMPVPAEIRESAREAARSRVEKTPQIDAPLLDPREDAELSEAIKDLVRRFSKEKKS